MERVNDSGFTLIELLVYIAVASVLFVSIGTFMVQVVRVRTHNALVADIESQSNYIASYLSRSIRHAQTVIAPAENNSGQQLSLSFGEENKNPTVFETHNGVLQIFEADSAPIDISSPTVIVSDFFIRNLSYPDTPGMIQIQFSLEDASPGEDAYRRYRKTTYVSASLR